VARERRAAAEEVELETGISIMHRFLLASALLLSFAGSVAAQETTKVTSLMSRDLSDIPGKEGDMLIVEYAPGAEDPVHRHNANAFVYVLEGSVVMQVKGGRRSPFTLVKPFMKVPTTYTLLVATPARRSQRSFSSSSLRTRVRPS
jgi:hypothetical protein